VITYYPATYIEEFVEVEAETPEIARELALDGEGYLLHEVVEYGSPTKEDVVSVELL
jgi:hypothetical protein